MLHCRPEIAHCGGKPAVSTPLNYTTKVVAKAEAEERIHAEVLQWLLPLYVRQEQLQPPNLPLL